MSELTEAATMPVQYLVCHLTSPAATARHWSYSPRYWGPMWLGPGSNKPELGLSAQESYTVWWMTGDRCTSYIIVTTHEIFNRLAISFGNFLIMI